MERIVTVGALATQLGVPIRDFMRGLAKMGLYAKSPSTMMTVDVANRVRRNWASLATEEPPRSPARREPSRSPRATPRGPRPDPPRGFTKQILDDVIVPRRDPYGPKPRSGYWPSEIRDANSLVSEWGPCLLQGMEPSDVLAWMRSDSGVGPERAVQLHDQGVRPIEVEWSYQDRGTLPLGRRLVSGIYSIEQVVAEVRYRRTLAS